MRNYCFLVLLVLAVAAFLPTLATQNTSFEVDYENQQFLLDGKPFRYVSGSFHYFRAPKQYWRDRLRKLRAAGLNAVSTYVEWSLHQPEPEKWVWDGEADIIEFIKIAQEEDLFVLLRPGPYICAERDLGGLPYWLLGVISDVKFRTRDEGYMKYVEIYLNEFLTRIKPFLRGNGGPVIMVQVENEYGSFYACDITYKKMLYRIFDEHVGNDAVLYTADGTNIRMLQCGTVEGTLATINFGTKTNVEWNFKRLREFEPRGPLVNSEFYPGWLSHWDEPYATVETKEVVKTLDEMLALGASVNFYMFYGGTNFGFTAGANDFNIYQPQLTSYDYDAPITEAGDTTPKYFEIRHVIAKYLPLPNVKIPHHSPKGEYGTVSMTPVLRLFDISARLSFGSGTSQSVHPPTFENLRIPHGFAMYEADIPKINDNSEEVILSAIPMDRILIYVDGIHAGTLSRSYNVTQASLPPNGKKLILLVENQGHLNYGDNIEDYKGVRDVTINNKPVTNWTITGFPLKSVSSSELVTGNDNVNFETRTLESGPQFLKGVFVVEGTPYDTFLNVKGWGKGVAYVNGHNLGRYWLIGPQMTLYVPAPFLRTGENELVLVELEYVPVKRKISFQTVPILDYPVPNEIQ